MGTPVNKSDYFQCSSTFGGHLHKSMILSVPFQQSSLDVNLSRYGQPCLGFSARPIVTVKGRINREKYRDILIDQVHHQAFQDDNAPNHAAGFVQ
ncbi:hypothetical protein TNCV_4707961 [Trichonephila clavipes]|nr:hypothetical protein TNCV_4707961 [Trichonephila clavipes]